MGIKYNILVLWEDNPIVLYIYIRKRNGTFSFVSRRVCLVRIMSNALCNMPHIVYNLGESILLQSSEPFFFFHFVGIEVRNGKILKSTTLYFNCISLTNRGLKNNNCDSKKVLPTQDVS